MKRALLFVNDTKPDAVSDFEKADDYLKHLGWDTTRIPVNEPEGGYDFGLAFGGDGTFLWAADIFSSIGIPMAGINTGHLGFLTTIDSSEIEKSIDKIIAGEYVTEECMMLDVYDQVSGEYMGKALNDVVFKNKMEHSVGRFVISVNGMKIYEISADGVIISAPTGSTAYVLSMGGPIVDTTCRLMIIQPIAAHTLNSRAVVINENDEVSVGFDVGPTSISRDGRLIEPSNGIYTIKKSTSVTRVMRFQDYNFYKIVSEKLSRG